MCQVIYEHQLQISWCLNKSSYTCRIVGKTEFLWSAIFFLLKNAVEIGHIVKAATVSNFVYTLRSVDQHS